jgi:NAD+ synthase (glutamine-hydrolysing)
MAGGFAVIKDIAKTLVYRLCHYRNAFRRVIPERIITRPPSRRTAPGPEGPGLAAAVRRARWHHADVHGGQPQPAEIVAAGAPREAVARSCG